MGNRRSECVSRDLSRPGVRKWGIFPAKAIFMPPSARAFPEYRKQAVSVGKEVRKEKQLSQSVSAEKKGCIAAFLLSRDRKRKTMVALYSTPTLLQMQCTITRSKVPAKMSRMRDEKRGCS
jgi:hypothetical protein